MKRQLLYTLIFAFLLPLTAFAQGISIEEHKAMENVSSARYSPDGSSFLYSHVTKESWDGRAFSAVMLKDVQSGELLQLTKGEWDYAPQWSPNGTYISFISYRNNLQQIYIIPAKGGEPKMASDAQYYLTDYAWVNDSIIAYIDDEERASELVEWEKENGNAFIFGTEFFTSAIWTYNIKSGEKEKITSGKERIIDLTISPNGKHLAVIAAKNYDTYEKITANWVSVLDWSGKELYRYDGAEYLNHPTFSPNGQQLAFAGSTVGYAANDGLFVADIQSRKTQNLTYDFDPTIEKIVWKDDRALFFSTPRHAHTGIYEVDLAGEIETSLAPSWVIYDFDYHNQQFLFSAAKSTKTNQLYTLAANATPEKAKAQTQINPTVNAKIKTYSEVIRYKSTGKTEVEAIVTYPPNYQKGKSYPLMVVPHGGPDAVVMDDFHWEGQYFADQGFVVCRPNFRGSVGYGREFYAGNRAEFGGNDFDDIMAGVDYLVKKGIADEEKLVIGGGSYGGYMANWAITQTDRFKAAISLAGISNWVSMYGQHEFSNRDIAIWEYKALPINNIKVYRKASPIFYVRNIETPLLILHGERDVISPTYQAWEMYRHMQDAGKEVKMIIYRRAGHSINAPHQFKSVLENWVNWAKSKL